MYVEYTIGTNSVGVVVVSCPACACLLARNGLVNEVEFLGFIPTNLFVSIRVFEQVWRKTLLGYNAIKACASPRNLTWLTRPFLLMRGWGLGTRRGWVHV